MKKTCSRRPLLAVLLAACCASALSAAADGANPVPAGVASATPETEASVPDAPDSPALSLPDDEPAPAAVDLPPVSLAPARAALPANSADGTANSADGTGNSYPLVSLEIPDNELVRKYRTMYTSPDGIKYLSGVMKRSALFRDYIRAETARLGVPECLFYLPVIESGFSVSAVSRSGATGVWQFMRNSISGYGIRVSEWMDERRDPWLATSAAIRKLKENFDTLGDWNLALAAYNCGLGATKNAVRRGGSADYWELCRKGLLKKETVHYVPKFLAIAEILSKSDEYGIDWGDDSSVPEFKTIQVQRAVSLDLLAKETGMDKALLRSANPALYYNITPPDASYGLRLPADSVEPIQTILSDRSRMLLEYYMYKIKSGDTLYALALHYGISVDMIIQYNPGLKPSALRIGKNIVIPALREVGAYRGRQDADNLDFSGNYLVKRGDTLWSIALAYNIQVETLAEKNNLDVNSVLKLGKALRVPIL